MSKAAPVVGDPIECLKAFLARRHPAVSRVEVRDHRPLTGGYSRVMARFTALLDGQALDLVSRADPSTGAGLGDTSRTAEWALLRALSDSSNVPIPTPRYFDESGAELGQPTIISDFVVGESMLARLRRSSTAERVRAANDLCDLLAQIHGCPLGSMPSTMTAPPNWNAYVDAQIATWRRTAADHIEHLPMLHHVADWLEAHRPTPAPMTLVHGEFQSANVLSRPDGSLVAVDWEMAHIGDPREDIASFKQVALVQPPDVIGDDDERFCAEYRARSGLDADVINPAAIAFFQILPFGAWHSLERIRAMARGERVSLVVPFNFGVRAVWHHAWLLAMRRAEQQVQQENAP